MKLYLMCAAVAAACLPGVVAAQDFDGARIEARLGYETPTVSDDGDVYKIGSAASYGGEVGYDFKAGKTVVVGPYAVYELSSVKLCDRPFCLKERGNLGVGARVGVGVSSNVLVYAKVGYAQIRFKATNGRDSKGGVQGGIGVNVNFGKQFYGLVEFNYADYGKFYGINLQRRHVAAGVGVRF